jgi:DNA polymerase-3 subunit epsilon
MILFFDTETTGLRPGKICQLSYIMQSKESVTAKNFFFSVPFVEPSALAVHGLSTEKLAVLSGGKRFSDHLEEIAQDFALADLIVAHNFSFDFNFMSKEFEYEYERFTYKQDFCTMKKFTPICKLTRSSSPCYKYPKLTELADFLDIYPYDATKTAVKLFGDSGLSHDARYDTAMLYLCFNAGAKYEEVKTAMENCL